MFKSVLRQAIYLPSAAKQRIRLGKSQAMHTSTAKPPSRAVTVEGNESSDVSCSISVIHSRMLRYVSALLPADRSIGRRCAASLSV